MIFVALGTQKFQFDRLLRDIDELVQGGVIRENVFAQIGNGSYRPKYYPYVRFMEPQEFQRCIAESTLFITHGGVGSILNGLKNGKTVIACPRLSRYAEHIDDHQVDITTKYAQLGYIMKCESKEELKKSILEAPLFQSTYRGSATEKRELQDFIIAKLKEWASYGK